MESMQPDDPVIDEARAVRHRISERCGHDPDRLVAYYMKLQRQFQNRMIKEPSPMTSADHPAA